MEWLATEVREIVNHLLATSELSHAQDGLVAVNLAMRHLDMCTSEVITCKGIYSKRDNCFILQLHIYNLMIHYVVVAMVHATAKCALLQLCVEHLVECLTLGNIEVANSLLALLVEVDCREGTTLLYAAVDTTLGATLGGIFSVKPAQRAKRTNLTASRFANPQQEVDIVTALCNKHGVGLTCFAP